MYSLAEIENLLSYFIDLIEKGGLSRKREQILYPENYTVVKLDKEKETITVLSAHIDESHEIHESEITVVFPEFLKSQINTQKELLFNNIIVYGGYILDKEKEQFHKFIAKRVDKLIEYENSNPFIAHYPSIIDSLNEILDFLRETFINNLPPSERLCVKMNKNSTVLLFTLLQDAGFFIKHSDADIAKFISARISYYDEGSRSYKAIVDPDKLISKFRRLDVNIEDTVNEIKNLINDSTLKTR